VVFSGTTVSSTNKTDHNDITEILLKVALNTIAITLILRAIHYHKQKLYYTYVLIELDVKKM
jgi:hypothetical protein